MSRLRALWDVFGGFLAEFSPLAFFVGFSLLVLFPLTFCHRHLSFVVGDNQLRDWECRGVVRKTWPPTRGLLYHRHASFGKSVCKGEGRGDPFVGQNGQVATILAILRIDLSFLSHGDILVLQLSEKLTRLHNHTVSLCFSLLVLLPSKKARQPLD